MKHAIDRCPRRLSVRTLIKLLQAKPGKTVLSWETTQNHLRIKDNGPLCSDTSILSLGERAVENETAASRSETCTRRTTRVV